MTTEEIKSLLHQESRKIEKKTKVIHLINRAIEKKSVLAKLEYYCIYGTSEEQKKDLEAINRVINRLVNYLLKLK